MDLLGSPGQLLLRLLSSTEERARVVAGNIANQNTPGYKRRDYQFEALLAEEIDKGKTKLDHIQSKTVIDRESDARGDGNNVVIEQEVASLRESALRYDMYAAILRSRVSMVQSAVREGR